MLKRPKTNHTLGLPLMLVGNHERVYHIPRKVIKEFTGEMLYIGKLILDMRNSSKEAERVYRKYYPV